jgi:hypothetical protein
VSPQYRPGAHERQRRSDVAGASLQRRGDRDVLPEKLEERADEEGGNVITNTAVGNARKGSIPRIAGSSPTTGAPIERSMSIASTSPPGDQLRSTMNPPNKLVTMKPSANDSTTPSRKIERARAKASDGSPIRRCTST